MGLTTHGSNFALVVHLCLDSRCLLRDACGDIAVPELSLFLTAVGLIPHSPRSLNLHIYSIMTDRSAFSMHISTTGLISYALITHLPDPHLRPIRVSRIFSPWPALVHLIYLRRPRDPRVLFTSNIQNYRYRTFIR